MYKVLLSIIHLSYSFIFNIISLKLSYRDVFCYTEHLLFTCRNIHDLVTLYLSEYVQYVLKTYADAFLFFSFAILEILSNIFSLRILKPPTILCYITQMDSFGFLLLFFLFGFQFSNIDML